MEFLVFSSLLVLIKLKIFSEQKGEQWSKEQGKEIKSFKEIMKKETR